MSDPRSLLERESRRFIQQDGAFERLVRRRDRKRRNQRIAAGVVGIAVFVAAVWIVTSGPSLDRSEKSVAPAGEVTGPAETGPAETAPPSAPASAVPENVMRQGTCRFVQPRARSRLELTQWVEPDWIKLRFEVHRSPVGHRWRIVLRHATGIPPYDWPTGFVFFEGTRVAGESGDLVVQRRAGGSAQADGFMAKAVDTQTGQVCEAYAYI